jgi:hypothetical protein
MKKLSLFVLVILVMFLISCKVAPDSTSNHEKNNPSYSITDKIDVSEVRTITDSIDCIPIDELFKYKSLSFEDESAPKEITIDFLGKTHIGYYCYSNHPYISNSNLIDNYENKDVHFSVNRITGEICDFLSSKRSHEYDTLYSKEELEQYVFTVFKSIGIDVNEFSLEIKEFKDDEPPYYIYILTKKAWNTDTVASAMLMVDVYGNIWAFQKNMIDEINNALSHVSEEEELILLEMLSTDTVKDYLIEQVRTKYESQALKIDSIEMMFSPKIVLIDDKIGVYYQIQCDWIYKDPSYKDYEILTGALEEFIVFPKSDVI